MPRAQRYRVKDVFGHWCEVSEIRTTGHQFDVYLGWIAGRNKGRAGGRSEVILTRPLAKYLTRLRMRPWNIDFPIAPCTVNNLRKRMGYHIRRDIRNWWEERREDLSTLSRVQFAKTHKRTKGAVSYQGKTLVGRRIKPRYWWKAPEVRALILSDKPDVEIAAALGIARSSVRRLRMRSKS